MNELKLNVFVFLQIPQIVIRFVLPSSAPSEGVNFLNKRDAGLVDVDTDQFVQLDIKNIQFNIDLRI